MRMPAPASEVLTERESEMSMPEIPVLRTGQDFPFETLIAEEVRARTLIHHATQYVPKTALRLADRISRRWLEKWDHDLLPEIDRIANHLDTPGAYYLSVNFEWGCTVKVGPGAGGGSPRLVRVLDWLTPGLGRYVIAVDVAGAAGPFLALTWPGYTGLLHAMAPGRFSAAVNQAPMLRAGGGVYPVDWAVGRIKVWLTGNIPPAHLLRRVFETAKDYNEAKRMLAETPIAIPAIFSLAGIASDECCVIERREDEVAITDGAATAANHWQRSGWRARGIDSIGRAARMAGAELPDFGDGFDWLNYPVCNKHTRLAMIADAGTGRVLAQGYEAEGAVTAVLDWQWAGAPAEKETGRA